MLAALRHLPGVRKALVHIAKGQEEMLDLLESGAARGGGGVDGEEDDDGDEEESELAGAADADETEEEDHGVSGIEVVAPEVLPAGTRAAASGGGA